MSDAPHPVRLRKYVRERTGLCLAKVAAISSRELIQVNGVVTTDTQMFVFPGDEVAIEGRPLPAKPATIAVMLHKPVGVVTSACAQDDTPDLSRWLSAFSHPLFPVGRLDCDSSGLLLLTNSGDLSFALLSPNHHVEKAYAVTLCGTLFRDDPRILALASPLHIDGEVMRAKRVTYGGVSERRTTVHITLTEGKHRQIRRMAGHVGLRVDTLHRHRVGPISLSTLESGETRALNESETLALWQAVGGKREVRERQLAALRRVAETERRNGHPHLRLQHWLATNDAAAT